MGLRRDIVYLGWPIATLYMSPHTGGEGGLRGLLSTAVHRSPNKLWRFNSIFNLWQPRSLPSDKCCQQTVWIHAAICRIFPELSASWWGWRDSSWAPQAAPVCLWPQEDCSGSWAQPPPLPPCSKKDHFYRLKKIKNKKVKNLELSNKLYHKNVGNSFAKNYGNF